MIDWSSVSEFSVPEGEVTKIERGGEVLWKKPSAGTIIYNGGAALEGAYAGTEITGAISFSSASGSSTDEAWSYSSDYAGIGTSGIYTNVDADEYLYEWDVGVFAIAIDVSNVSTIMLEFTNYGSVNVVAYTQKPLIQMSNSDSLLSHDEEINSYAVTSNRMTLDVGEKSGVWYLRLVGDISCSKIELT